MFVSAYYLDSHKIHAGFRRLQLVVPCWRASIFAAKATVNSDPAEKDVLLRVRHNILQVRTSTVETGYVYFYFYFFFFLCNLEAFARPATLWGGEDGRLWDGPRHHF